MADGGKHQFVITGHDPRADNEKKAQSMGAIDHSESRAFNAVRDKDIVVLALPYENMKAAYELIAPDLRDGVVILDASLLKMPSLQWADKFLTAEHHVIGITPIINPKQIFVGETDIDAASVDLFDKSSMILTPSVSSIREAIDLAVNFSTILGATPHFLDPVEHDSLLTFTEGLPSLLSVAYFASIANGEGWKDIQRLTNSTFGVLTQHLFHTHPDALRDEWIANRDNLARGLDDVIKALQMFRTLLVEDDRSTLEGVLGEASDAYETWINKRHNGNWDDEKKVGEGAGFSIMGTLFGGAIARRMRGDGDEDDD